MQSFADTSFTIAKLQKSNTNAINNAFFTLKCLVDEAGVGGRKRDNHLNDTLKRHWLYNYRLVDIITIPLASSSAPFRFCSLKGMAKPLIQHTGRFAQRSISSYWAELRSPLVLFFLIFFFISNILWYWRLLFISVEVLLPPYVWKTTCVTRFQIVLCETMTWLYQIEKSSFFMSFIVCVHLLRCWVTIICLCCSKSRVKLHTYWKTIFFWKKKK